MYERVTTDRYLVTDAMFQETIDARKTYNPGDISPNTGLEKQTDGSWAPPKKVDNGDIKHGDLYKKEDGTILRVKILEGKGYNIQVKFPGKNTIHSAVYKDPKVIKDFIGKAKKIGNDPKTSLDKINVSSKESPAKQKPPLTAQTKIKVKKERIENPLFAEPEKEKPTVTNGYESYQGIKTIDNKLRPKWKQLYDKLKDPEYDAISAWQEPMSGDKYQDFQAYARDPVNYDERKQYLSKDEVAQHVKNMDSAFKKTPAIGTNLTVVSGQSDYNMFYNAWGIKEKNIDKLAEALKNRVGETLTNKSYLSTSVNEKGAEGWHEDSKVEIRVDVPKDKRCMYLTPLSIDNNEYTEDDLENELLINRGAKYRLDEVKVGRNRGGRKAVLVKMTLVSDGVKE